MKLAKASTTSRLRSRLRWKRPASLSARHASCLSASCRVYTRS
jgi:hypothetical protein